MREHGGGAGGVRIRAATSGDVDVLTEVQRAASVAGFAHIFPPDRYPFPTAAVAERWSTALEDPELDVIVAEDAHRAIGLVAVRRPSCWLEALYVLRERWSTGVAAELHDRALACLRDSSCASAHLWVLEHNARARAFYERRGWRPNDETRAVPFPPYPVDVGYTLDLAAGERL